MIKLLFHFPPLQAVTAERNLLGPISVESIMIIKDNRCGKVCLTDPV